MLRAYKRRLADIFGTVDIQDGLRRPPPDALVVLRAVEPPDGLYSYTVWSVVWRPMAVSGSVV